MVISFCRIAEKILFCPCFIEISLCAYRHFIQILYWIVSDSACLGVSCNSDRGLWICLGRQFGRCPELNASRSLRRISQRRYFCVQLPPRPSPFLHSPNADSQGISALAVIVDCATIKSRCNSVRELRPNNQWSMRLIVATRFPRRTANAS